MRPTYSRLVAIALVAAVIVGTLGYRMVTPKIPPAVPTETSQESLVTTSTGHTRTTDPLLNWITENPLGLTTECEHGHADLEALCGQLHIRHIRAHISEFPTVVALHVRVTQPAAQGIVDQMRYNPDFDILFPVSSIPATPLGEFYPQDMFSLGAA